MTPPCARLLPPQEEDNSTYNFRWYTSYACPEEPLECLVTDPLSMEQYDLSRCGRPAGASPARSSSRG